MTSPGGAVGDYGLAASLFARLKAGGVRTTACVDLVAASGGYMLACTADKILAAPFSTVGSIGAPPAAARAAPAPPATWLCCAAHRDALTMELPCRREGSGQPAAKSRGLASRRGRVRRCAGVVGGAPLTPT